MSINYTQEEQATIAKYGLKKYGVCDARGIHWSSVNCYAKARDCHFIIWKPCPRGHRLRTRNRQCVICRPASISYQIRGTRAGSIYIATSGEYCKVGIVECRTLPVWQTLKNRNGSLNAEDGYGNIKDWTITRYYKVSRDLGNIERVAHQILAKYHIPTNYTNSRRIVEGRELLKCDKDTAIEAVESAIRSYGYILDAHDRDDEHQNALSISSKKTTPSKKEKLSDSDLMEIFLRQSRSGRNSYSWVPASKKALS